jgi:AcrR family transcriptional regulator
MNVRSKITADDMRDRIATVAEEQFRRMGFAKTAVADIAAALGMSTANVYRFFPSKHAIVETICNRCLRESEVEIAEVVRRTDPAAVRIQALFQAILRYHKENFLSDRRVHDMVLVAIEHNWQNIEAHKGRIRASVAKLLNEGIAAGEFVSHDTEEAAQILMNCCIRFCHPVLISQSIDDGLEDQLRATLVFVLRSIAPH